MRRVAALVVMVLAASVAWAEESPFLASRGALTPPPRETSGAGAPPEGVAAGGLDFGAWRSPASPDRYAAFFLTSVRALEAKAGEGRLAAALTANGFTCFDAASRPRGAPTLECRFTAFEGGCEHEWWAVQESRGAAVLAGHDAICARGD